MESNGQRLYSVLTRTEVREKMMKEIELISEVFSLSQSDATVILIHLGWNSFKASDVLGDDKEKFLAELGLVQVSDSNQNESISSSADLEITHTDGNGDNLVSTPFCSHKFCSDCWRHYLSESLEEQNNKDERVLISCLNQDCVASVGPDTIEKLAEPVKEMYERYVMGSFMKSNKESMKWCPAPGCYYAIERDEYPSEDDESIDFGVVCLCGHTFCWKCQLESHRPVTCNNASLWWNDLLEEARTLARMAKKTKPCPRCHSLVEKNDDPDLRNVTCLCSYTFCWRCLRSKEEHKGTRFCFELSVPPPSNQYALTHHLKLWEESDVAMQISKRDLEAIERNIIPKLTANCSLIELAIRALREAWMLVVQCRLVLKWSCVFGYFITNYHSAKKQYLDHLREEATANLLKHQGALYELTNGAISGGDINAFRHKLESTTTTTGNYFHFFLKTLEDGLCDVKVDAYEDAPIDYWFCDRCTFQNDCSDQKCRMCVVPFESSPHVAFGNNSSTGSAHHQKVPNSPNNPLARQGGTNSFEFPPVVAFGNNNGTASAPQQQVPNMFYYPFGCQGGTNLFESPPVAFGYNSISPSAHQQQFPNMPNNPFARQGGTNLFESPPVAFGCNSISASAHQQQFPNMPNNPFARQGGTNLFESPPRVVFGNNNISASAHQQQVPNMSYYPFPLQGGTNPFQSPPVAFGNNYSTASAHQQQVPNMPSNPFAGQGGINPFEFPPFVAFGNNNTASDHQHQAQTSPIIHWLVEEPIVESSIENE